MFCPHATHVHRARHVLLIAALGLCSVAFAQPSGYGYGKQVLVRGTRIMGSSPLTNFPVLVDITANELRSTANGGHVQNGNGYDITFTSANCSTVLRHEIESYNAGTGRLVAWVQVPTLTPGTNFNMHMYYGRSGVSANPSTAGVWSGYAGVWHFQGGSMADGTGKGGDATNQGTTTQSPAYLNDGRAANGTQWMQVATFPDLTTSFSMSAWIYTTDQNKAGQRIFADDEQNTGGYAFSVSDETATTLRFYSRSINPVSLDTPSGSIQNNTWYHVTAVADMTAKTRSIYINGALAASGSFTGNWGTDAGLASMAGETASGETGNRFAGRLDEIRVANSALSAGWVATEFNNQSAPGSFFTISGEYTAATLCAVLPIELLDFDARNEDDRRVSITWSTASEQDNDHFAVERSTNGDVWTIIAEQPGAGDSQQVLHYSAVDGSPVTGMAYYRLRQVDTDGAFSFSPIRVVEVDGRSRPDLALAPNPASTQVSISCGGLVDPELVVHDMHGQLVRAEAVKDSATAMVDVGDLPNGIYLVTLRAGNATKSARLMVAR